MKKKVLFLSRTLGKTGVPVFLRSLLNEIDLERYDVTVGLEDNSDTTQLKFLKSGINVIFYNADEYKRKNDRKIEQLNKKYKNSDKKILWKLTNQLIKKQEIRRVKSIFTENYDYAFAFHQGKASKYLAYLIVATKKYYFYHASYPMPDCKQRYFLRADRLIFVSNGAKQNVLSKWSRIKPSICDVVSPLIDDKLIIELSNKNADYHYINSAFKLLTVGRIVKDKGFDLLIDTAMILRYKIPNFEWFIIGDGCLFKTITNEIKMHNLEKNIKTLGLLENPYPYFKSCDLYISTSKYEPFGIVMLESSIFGKRFVATKTDGAIDQISNGQDGVLVNYDSNEMAQKIFDFYREKENKGSKINSKFNYLEYKKKIVNKIEGLLND